MDVETRSAIATELKEACPLRSVLKKGRPCPYFGASGTCGDCSYDWISIAADVGKLAKTRRALYEKEVEKRKVLEAELSDARSILEGVSTGCRAVFEAIKYIRRCGPGEKEEELDVGREKDKGTASSEK